MSWAVHNVDCLEFLKSLPDGSVDAVVTDPPYGIGLKYASFSDGETETIALVRAAITECRRIAKCVLVSSGCRVLWNYPQPDDVGTVFMPNAVGAGRWGFNGNNPILYYGKCPYLSLGKGSRPNSVSATTWKRRKNPEHPCEKPEKWMEWMVARATVGQGETVLDPFCGSGTTGVACVKTGRNFIGCEIDAGYCEIARRRIAEAEASIGVFTPGS